MIIHKTYKTVYSRMLMRLYHSKKQLFFRIPARISPSHKRDTKKKQYVMNLQWFFPAVFSNGVHQGHGAADKYYGRCCNLR